MARYKRSLKNLFVDLRFQMKYTALVLLVSLLIFLVLGWMYYAEWEASNKLMKEINPIVQKATVPNPPPEVSGDMAEIDAILNNAGMDKEETKALNDFESEFQDEMSDRSAQSMALMIGSVGLLVILLAGISIWLSHKAAGPIYAMRLFIRAARKGQWSRIRPLRKGDEFVYLSEEFMDLVQEIRGRHTGELEDLDEISTVLASGDTAKAAELLKKLNAAKKAYLDGSQAQA
jgi:hypothetical protein